MCSIAIITKLSISSLPSSSQNAHTTFFVCYLEKGTHKSQSYSAVQTNLRFHSSFVVVGSSLSIANEQLNA